MDSGTVGGGAGASVDSTTEESTGAGPIGSGGPAGGGSGSADAGASMVAASGAIGSGVTVSARGGNGGCTRTASIEILSPGKDSREQFHDTMTAGRLLSDELEQHHQRLQRIARAVTRHATATATTTE